MERPLVQARHVFSKNDHGRFSSNLVLVDSSSRRVFLSLTLLLVESGKEKGGTLAAPSLGLVQIVTNRTRATRFMQPEAAQHRLRDELERHWPLVSRAEPPEPQAATPRAVPAQVRLAWRPTTAAVAAQPIASCTRHRRG